MLKKCLYISCIIKNKQMKNTIILSEDNKQLQLWVSKFDKNIGDIINFQGKKFKVVDTNEEKIQLKYIFKFYNKTGLFKKYEDQFFNVA